MQIYLICDKNDKKSNWKICFACVNCVVAVFDALYNLLSYKATEVFSPRYCSTFYR